MAFNCLNKRLPFSPKLCLWILITISTAHGAVILSNSTITKELQAPSPSVTIPTKETTFQLDGPPASKRASDGDPEHREDVNDDEPKNEGKPINKNKEEDIGYWLPPPRMLRRPLNYDRYNSNHDSSNRINVQNSEPEENEDDDEEERNSWNSVDLWEPHERRKQNGEFPLQRPFVQDSPLDGPGPAIEREEDEDGGEDWRGRPQDQGEGEEEDSRGRRILYRVMESVNSVCSTLFPFVEALGGERFCVKNPSTEYLGINER